MRKFLIGCLFICLFTGAAHGEDLFPTSKYVLDNGMPVIISELADNPMVSVYCLIKAGAATEGPYLGSGISHFVEHMLFKTTEKREVGVIAKEIQAMGGSVNASTSLDFTIYTITVPADKFDEALDVLVDMVTSATFDVDEVEKEREVIHREMDLVNDRPRRRISRLTFRNVYTKHPYQHPTIGYRALFDKITRNGLYDYYKTQYVPNNMVFSVAGNVRAEEVLPKIEKAFADFSREFYPIRMLEQEPDQVTERYLEEEFEIPHTYVSMAYQGVRLMDQDLYPLDVLAHILGHGQTSRLYKDLYIKQGIVYGVSVFNFTPVDKGAFEIELQLDKENMDKAMTSTQQHIKDVQKNGVRPKELEIAISKMKSDYIFQHQHTSSIAWAQALDEAFTGSYAFSQKYLQGISRVTSKDIQRVAQQYLQDQRLSISVLKPKKTLVSKEPLDEQGAVLNTQKHVLDNGLTVLLRENHMMPIISIRLGMEAGMRQEDKRIQGVSQLAGNLWIRGTKRRTFDAINELTASSGMLLGSTSGRYSLGIHLEILPEHLQKGLDLFTDVVYNPTFPEDHLKQLVINTKQSLKQRDQTPYPLANYELQKIMFPTHPFGWQASGTEESLDQITHEDVDHFYRTYLTPENMVLSMVGDFNATEMLTRIQKDFGKLKKTDIQLHSFTEKPITEPRFTEKRLDKDQAVVLFGFHGPTIYADDHYQAKLAGSILGSSFSGRMFSNIRDKLSKAYTLGGGYAGGLDAGMFKFYITTTDENVDIVIDLMKKEIIDLQVNLVSDEELENLKTYLKGMNKSGRQTNYEMNLALHYDELYGLGHDNYLKFDEQIDKVTKEEVQRIAQEYWDLNTMAISIVRPLAKKETQDE